MAMIPCPECTKQISDKASNCPNCGYPIAAVPPQQSKEARIEHSHVTRTGARWEGIGFVLIVFGLISIMSGIEFGGALIAIGFVVFLVGRFK